MGSDAQKDREHGTGGLLHRWLPQHSPAPVATCHTAPAPPRRCSRRPGRREGQSPSVGPAPSTPAACRVLRRHRTGVGRGGAPEEAM